MSDQNIKVGDRAEVVKWRCCGKFDGVKMLVTKVGDLRINYVRMVCCGNQEHITGVFAVDNTVPIGGEYLVSAPIEWLRKLPGLAEGETRETEIFDNEPETVK